MFCVGLEDLLNIFASTIFILICALSVITGMALLIINISMARMVKKMVKNVIKLLNYVSLLYL